MAKDWLKNLSGVFLKPEEQGNAAPAEQPAPPSNPNYAAPSYGAAPVYPVTPGVAPAPTYAASPGYPTMPTVGAPDEKSIKHFEKLLADSNFEGTDYFEFSTMLQTMRSSGLPEPNLFQLTFNSLKALNPAITGPELVAKLLDTATKYVDICNQNKVSFEQDVEAAKQQRVGSLQQQVEFMTQENNEAAEQIRQLQEKIQQNSQKIAELSGEMAVQNANLITKLNNYVATHSLVVGNIEADKQKIQQYLSAVQ